MHTLTDQFTERSHGVFRFLSREVISGAFVQEKNGENLIRLLVEQPPYVLVLGDTDDAMITLSDAQRQGVDHVVLCSSAQDMCIQYLQDCSWIRSVTVIPSPDAPLGSQPQPQAHSQDFGQIQSIITAISRAIPNCRGVGLKAFDARFASLFSTEERERLSRVDIAGSIAVNTVKNSVVKKTDIHSSAQQRPTVVVHAHDICVPAGRTLRPIINPRWWAPLMHALGELNAEIIITGSEELRHVYATPAGSTDMRSSSTEDQRAVLSRATMFVSSDSAELVIAALHGVQCLRCAPMRGIDMFDYVSDREEYIYSRFRNIQTVSSAEELCRAVKGEERPATLITGVHRNNFSSFHPVFWQRSYATAKQVLIKSSTAVGDSLMISGVVRAIKERYPHPEITVSGPQHILDLYRTHPDVSRTVLRGSAAELVCERDADEVVEYNFIMDRLPEYYHGIHLFDVFANIAGVALPSKDIAYEATEQEIESTRRVLENRWSHVDQKLILGVHFSTNKDAERSYPHAAELVSALLQRYPSLCVVNAGTEQLGFSHERLLECSSIPEWGLREHIAAMSHCQKAITIDSSFLHVVHNLWSKPTLMLQTVSRMELIVNMQRNTIVPVRNSAHGCTACYWLKPTCKRDCMAALEVQTLLPQAIEFLEDRLQPMSMQSAAHADPVLVEYDADASKIAQVFHENARAKRFIKAVVMHTSDLPEYAQQWNGVQVLQQETQRSTDEHAASAISTMSMQWI
ncbi:MAG: glycosyltransferase family 9 protein [Candidatus Kapaibacterium sp.]